MDIELLNTNGDVITRLQNVRNPEVNFNNVWKSQYNAAAWRGYIPPFQAEPSLAEVIADALIKIDEEAGKARLRYLTSAPGQEATYQEKYQDATNYIAAGTPADLTPFPWIAAESTATGKTATDAANAIIATRALWVTKGAMIEGERIKGKTDVRLAADPATARTIRNTTISNLTTM